GQALVTHPKRREQNLKDFKFDVRDLLAGSSDDDLVRNDLAGAVERFVEPTAWQGAGGPGTIELDGDQLVLRQTAPVAQQVSNFLDKLRIARGKPALGEEDGRPRSLASSYDVAEALLNSPVTANFHQAAPLAEIVEHLRGATGAQILFDGLDMATVGASEKSEAKLTAADEPLGDALTSLLEPLRLSFQIVNAKTLLIASAETIRQRYEVEFYAAKDLIDADQPADVLIERIKSELAPSSWEDAGGPARIEFDAASSCLIVLQTQPRQFELEQLLDSWKPKDSQ
ncbi:MAG TPA: hypothetical protein VHC19_27650, partial [Pirellulales bacterium]|nr:hypothetical protein [Pirellulales bacterium]